MSLLVRERYSLLEEERVRVLERKDYLGLRILDVIPPEIRESNILVQVTYNGQEIDDDGLYENLDEGDLTLRAIPQTGIDWGVLIATVLISTAIGTALNYIIQAIIGPPEKPKSQKQDSPTYGFDTPRNTTANGTPISIVYGQTIVAGHVLQAKTRLVDDSTVELLMLFGLGEGGDEGWQEICGQTADTDWISAPDTIEINENIASTFKDVQFACRLGRRDQAVIPGFEDTVVATVPLGVVVSVASGPFTYTTSQEVDSIAVLLVWQRGLVATDSKDGLRPYSVTYSVEYRKVGDVTYTVVGGGNKRVTKLTTTEFRAEVRIENLQRGLYEIRVTRITADDASTATVSEMTLQDITEIISDDLAYPGKALAAVRMRATDQLHGSQPNVTFRVKAIKPRVYTDTDTYTYVFTRNPAWIILDILRSKRYGLGRLIGEERITIEDFIAFAVHAGEEVLNSDGTATEPRYLVDGVIDESKAAWEWVYLVAQSAQASIFRSGGQYRVKADEVSTPVMMFNPANSFDVVLGYTAPTERVNYVEATFFDENDRYRPNPVVGLDQSVTDIQDYVKESIEYRVVTRRSQALQLANYRINANQLTPRFARWKADILACRCEPGDVVELAYDNVLWGLVSGRIKDATAFAIKIDRELTLESSKSYEVRVWRTDGTFETRPIISESGIREVLSISGPFTDIPEPGSYYSIGETTQPVKQIRIIDMQRFADMTFEFFGVEYNPLVYSREVVQLPEFTDTVGFDARKPPPDVTNLRATERVITLQDGSLEFAIDVSWTEPVSAILAGYYVWMKLAQHADFIDTPRSALIKGSHFRLEGDLTTGETYDIAVTPTSIFGVRKHPANVVPVRITIRGNTRRPADVTGFNVARLGDTLAYSWNAVDDFDLLGYEIRQGADWESGIPVVVNWTSVIYETKIFFADPEAPVTQTFLIKAINTSLIYSINAASVTITIDPRIDTNLIIDRDEKALDWPGGVSPSGSLDPTGSSPNKDLVLDVTNGHTTGTYETAEIDIGALYRSFTSVLIQATQVDTTTTWANATFTWASTEAQNRTWSGPVGANNMSVVLEAKYDDSTPIATSYAPFVAGERTFRYARFRVTLSTTDLKFTAKLTKFRMLFDVPDVLDGDEGIEVTGTADIDYNKAYSNAGSISLQITMRAGPDGGEQLDPGDFFRITNKDTDGFTITIYNAANTQLTEGRTIDWISRGY